MDKKEIVALLEQHLTALLKEDKKQHTGEERLAITTAIIATARFILQPEN